MAGNRTDPSACWPFSSRAMMVRVIAQRVPFSVATGTVASPPSRVRMSSRRAWNWVQLDADETSRY
jgi:hypothetical protein